MTDLPVITAVLQGLASLLAFPVAASLPYNLAIVAALIAADLVALDVVLRPRWSSLIS